MGHEPASPTGYWDILRQGDATSHAIGIQFLDCYRSAIPITSFYEMKAFRGLVVCRKIVDKKSATLYDYRRKSNHRERRVGLNADHNGIVKFSCAGRGLGRDVLIEIKRLADEVLRSGSSGLASGSTEASTDDEASGSSQSAAASWEEGSVQYFGDEDVDTEMREDESIHSSDDCIDTEMRGDDIMDEAESASTSYQRRETTSSSGPRVRQHDPFDTHPMPEFATRSNIDHNQCGPQKFPIETCFYCVFSKDHQCPSHCKNCQKKRSYCSPKPNYPGNNRNRQSFNGSAIYWEEAELCQQHKTQWSKPKEQAGSRNFMRSTKQPPFDSVRSLSNPQHKIKMPAAKAPPDFASPQTSSQYGPRIWNPTPPRQPRPPPPSSRRPPVEEEDEKARREGRNRKVRKTHQDHSEPSDVHTRQRESRIRSPNPPHQPRSPPPRRTPMEEEDKKARRKGRNTKIWKTLFDAHMPQGESRGPTQGPRRSQRINNDRQVFSPKPHPQASDYPQPYGFRQPSDFQQSYIYKQHIHKHPVFQDHRFLNNSISWGANNSRGANVVLVLVGEC